MSGPALAQERRTGSGLWHRIGRQLAHPSGLPGYVAGRFMIGVNRQPYRLALAALDPQPQDHVLEIGFGPGAGLAALAERVTGGRICGLDGAADMARLAARRNRKAVAAGRVSLATGDVHRLPWPAESFDKVLAVNVAYFFDREGGAVREMARVLRPGGLAVLYVTDRATMRAWPFAGPETHVTYDARDLQDLLLRGGFAPGAIAIRPVRLAMKVQGLIATARRSAA